MNATLLALLIALGEADQSQLCETSPEVEEAINTLTKGLVRQLDCDAARKLHAEVKNIDRTVYPIALQVQMNSKLLPSPFCELTFTKVARIGRSGCVECWTVCDCRLGTSRTAWSPNRERTLEELQSFVRWDKGSDLGVTIEHVSFEHDTGVTSFSGYCYGAKPVTPETTPFIYTVRFSGPNAGVILFWHSRTFEGDIEGSFSTPFAILTSEQLNNFRTATKENAEEEIANLTARPMMIGLVVLAVITIIVSLVQHGKLFSR